jgi:hypothetical protein
MITNQRQLIQTIAFEASFLMDTGIEPTSAIKAAANDNGIPYDDEMDQVVILVGKYLGL